jgi:hypothetical protein
MCSGQAWNKANVQSSVGTLFDHCREDPHRFYPLYGFPSAENLTARKIVTISHKGKLAEIEYQGMAPLE